MATEIKGLNYFPVDIHFFQSDKIAVIEADYGLKALAVVFKLLCRIYSEGFYMVWDERACKLFRLNACAECSAEELQTIVEALVREGFFSAECFDQYRVLTSRGIQRRFFEAAARRKRLEIARRELLLVEPAGEAKREAATEGGKKTEKKNETVSGETQNENNSISHSKTQSEDKKIRTGETRSEDQKTRHRELRSDDRSAESMKTREKAYTALYEETAEEEKEAERKSKTGMKMKTQPKAGKKMEKQTLIRPEKQTQAQAEIEIPSGKSLRAETAQKESMQKEERTEKQLSTSFQGENTDIYAKNEHISCQRIEKEKREKESKSLSESTSTTSTASACAGKYPSKGKTQPHAATLAQVPLLAWATASPLALQEENRLASAEENPFALQGENRFASAEENQLDLQEENRFASAEENQLDLQEENRFASAEENQLDLQGEHRLASAKENPFALPRESPLTPSENVLPLIEISPSGSVSPAGVEPSPGDMISADDMPSVVSIPSPAPTSSASRVSPVCAVPPTSPTSPPPGASGNSGNSGNSPASPVSPVSPAHPAPAPAPAFADTCRHWRDALTTDEDWRASIVRISGKGIRTLTLLPAAMALFEDHITTIGERHTLRTCSDYARRFVSWWRCLGFNTPAAITRATPAHPLPATHSATRPAPSPDIHPATPTFGHPTNTRPTHTRPALTGPTLTCPSGNAPWPPSAPQPPAPTASRAVPVPSRAEQALQTSATAADIALQLISRP